MMVLRKFVLLLVMTFFLFLALVITNLVSVEFLDREFTHFSPMNFFKVLTVLGAALVALVLAVEQSHAALLRRRVGQLETSVGQLKAQLFDAHQRQAATSSVAVIPPTDSREAPRPNTPPDSL